jgi:hypothetical protein
MANMRGHGSGPIAALRRALGATSPPSTITQEAFDRDVNHLRRLVQLNPGERAQPGDLWNYTEDLRHTRSSDSCSPICFRFAFRLGKTICAA